MTIPRRLALTYWSKEAGICAAFLTLAVLTRLPVLSRSVLDWDESLYLVMADQWRHGHLPYTTIWDNKPIGIYAIFAVFQALLGPRVLAIRAASMVCAGVSACLVYLVIRRLGIGRGRGPAVFGGGAYLLGALSNDGLAANTEPFMACCTLAAMAFASGTGQRGAPARAFAAGIAVGAAFMIKYVSVLEAPAVLLLVLRGPGRSWRQQAELTAIFGAGAALPLLATIVLYWHASMLTLWWHCAIIANFRRAGAVVPPGALAYAARIELERWGPLFLAGVAVLAAGARRFTTRPWPDNTLILGLWLAGGCLGVAAARSFYDHYFLQILPVLCVCLAWCAARLAGRPRIALILGALALAPPAFAASIALRDGAAPVLSWQNGPKRRADMPTQIARDLVAPLAAAHGGLYVFDSEPILYVLLGQTPPTSYAFPSILTTRFLAHVAGVNAPAEITRILATRPLFIVRRPTPRHSDNPIDPEVYAIMNAGLAANYRIWRRYEQADVYERK